MAGESPVPPAAPPLKVAAFRCAACGAPVTLRAPGRSQVASCDSCGVVLDANDPNHRVLAGAVQGRKAAPDIPLGARGALGGVTWEAIGFMRRRDGSAAYGWSEYLLYNPWRGFRWLVESEGHWTLVRMSADRPDDNGDGSFSYRGERYKEFLSGSALVQYVEGEFYWRVEVGERVSVSDFVAPPHILSREISGDEISWSHGEYLPADVVASAFRLDPPPYQIGVAACQPFPGGIKPRALAALALLMVGALFTLQLYTVVRSESKPLYSADLTAHAAGPERQIVTPPFTVDIPTRDLELVASSPVNNNWLYLDASLVNESTQESFPADLEVSYYQGVDDGESWSEGSQRADRLLSSVPPGVYHLEIETTLPGNMPARDFHVEVIRDVPVWRSFWLLVAPLLAVALGLGIAGFSFEAKRWSQSDHPFVTSSSGNDDHDG